MDKYPDKTKSDKVIDGLHVGAQLVPFGIGGALSQLVSSFFPQGFEKRKEEWFQCLIEKIEMMPEDLSKQTITYFETEEGKTLFLKAALAAISTHKRKKYQVIRDVLLNAVNDRDIHYDQKEIYVGIITDLEPYDLVLLKIIDRYYEDLGGINSYEDAFKICKHNGFQGDRDEFVLIINKLKDKSLIRISDDIDGFGDVYAVEVIISESTNNMPKIKITDFAKRLVIYIKETA